jgi:hypothetical protein
MEIVERLEGNEETRRVADGSSPNASPIRRQTRSMSEDRTLYKTPVVVPALPIDSSVNSTSAEKTKKHSNRESLDYEEHCSRSRRLTARSSTLDETSLTSYFTGKPFGDLAAAAASVGGGSGSGGLHTRHKSVTTIVGPFTFTSGSPSTDTRAPAQNSAGTAITAGDGSVSVLGGDDIGSTSDENSSVDNSSGNGNGVHGNNKVTFGPAAIATATIETRPEESVAVGGDEAEDKSYINVCGKSYSELDLVSQCPEDLASLLIPAMGGDSDGGSPDSTSNEVSTSRIDRDAALSPDAEEDITAAAAGLNIDDDDLNEPVAVAAVRGPESVPSSFETPTVVPTPIKVHEPSVGPAAQTSVTTTSSTPPPVVAAQSGKISTKERPVTSLKYPFLMPLGHGPVVHTVPNNLSMVEDLTRAVLIGVGSNSEIFMIESSGVRVAVKMIKESCRLNVGAMTECEIEYETLIRLDHPNVIRIYGAGHKPRRFLVLEYISGINLNALLMRNIAKKGLLERLLREPTFNYRELLVRALEIADVCWYLHERYHKDTVIIHRGNYFAGIRH